MSVAALNGHADCLRILCKHKSVSALKRKFIDEDGKGKIVAVRVLCMY